MITVIKVNWWKNFPKKEKNKRLWLVLVNVNYCFVYRELLSMSHLSLNLFFLSADYEWLQQETMAAVKLNKKRFTCIQKATSGLSSLAWNQGF